MKLSVITVCYNAKECIEKALLSIQAQTYKGIEKVIVDGGSSDGTQGIVKRYLLPGDKFVSEQDDGIYDAMNKGVTMATGDVVYFLNADDIFADPNVVNQIMTMFSEDLSKVIVYGRVSYANAPVGIKERQPRQIYSAKAFLTNTICHQAVFARRNLFVELGGFNSSYKYVADQEWLLRVYKRYGHHFFYQNRVVAFYHYQGRSFQSSGIVRREKQSIFCQHFPANVYFLYWLRYVFIRGLKKKIFREAW